MTDTPPTSAVRPRFSLLTIFLLMTIAAMGIVIAQLAPLRSEVKRLRQQAGILSVGDKNLVHAIGVETYQRRAWKWRVWCPAGKRVVVRLATSEVPLQLIYGEEVFPKPHARLALNSRNAEGAEVEVSVAAEPGVDGRVYWNLHIEGMTRIVPVPEAASDWLLKGCSGWQGGGTISWTAVETSGKPMRLLWLRAHYKTKGTPTPPSEEATADGAMAWLEIENVE